MRLQDRCIIHEKMEQGSEEWFKARQAVITGTDLKSIITAKTQKLSAGLGEKLRELIAEIYIPVEDFTSVNYMYTGKKFIGNQFTDHGNEFEEEARLAFQYVTGLKTKTVGFITRKDRVVGCSPDFLIVDSDGEYVGGGEIKAKCLKNHLEVVLSGELPDDHKQQVHGAMLVTGFDHWYFISYFPGFTPVIIKVLRDDYTDKLEQALDEGVIKYSEALSTVKDRLKPLDPDLFLYSEDQEEGGSDE